MTQTWFAFRAYNSQTLYGFGTEDEADRYTDILNENRAPRQEINHYRYALLEANDVAKHGLNSRDDTFNLDDELAARS